MKTRNIILTILAAVLVAVPGTVVAQSGSGYGPGGGGGYGPHGGHHGGFAGGRSMSDCCERTGRPTARPITTRRSSTLLRFETTPQISMQIKSS